METSAMNAEKLVRRLLPALLLPFLMLNARSSSFKDCVAASNQGAPPPEIQKQLAGTWSLSEDSTFRNYSACCIGPGENVPFSPAYRTIRNEFANIPEHSPQKTINNLSHCGSVGVPGILQHPIMFEFLPTPGRINLIFHDGTLRRIWTDGRTFPASLDPTIDGYSIGHWEGKSLVVETRGLSRKSEIFLEGPIKATHQTKYTERMTVESDKLLRIQMTIEDPVIFSHPYTFESTYNKVPIIFETGCTSANRDNNGRVDLTPPEDD
jgi:hypothetical protein